MKHTFKVKKIKQGGKTYTMIFANEYPYIVGQVQDIGAEVWNEAMRFIEDSDNIVAKVDGRKDFVLVAAGVHRRVEIGSDVQWQELQDTLQEMALWWAEQNPHVKSIWEMD